MSSEIPAEAPYIIAGGGVGEITFRMAAAGEGTTLVGLDNDSEAIRLAQADPRAAQYPNCQFMHGEAATSLTPPLAPSSVTSSSTLRPPALAEPIP